MVWAPIPEDWIANLELKDLIAETAEDLCIARHFSICKQNIKIHKKLIESYPILLRLFAIFDTTVEQNISEKNIQTLNEKENRG